MAMPPEFRAVRRCLRCGEETTTEIHTTEPSEYKEEINALRAKLAVAVVEADNLRLRDALKTCVCAMQDYQAGIGITEMFDRGEVKGRTALSQPPSTEALDAIVAERVKELEKELEQELKFYKDLEDENKQLKIRCSELNDLSEAIRDREELEAKLQEAESQIKEVEQQRDELLAALKELVSVCDKVNFDGFSFDEWVGGNTIRECKATISKIEGEKN